MRGDIQQVIEDAIESILDERLEYEENHSDSGNSYSHLPKEGGFCYGEGERRLAEFMAENEIDSNGLDIDTIVNLVLDNFEMVSEHMFSSQKENIFVVDSFPVGEIEVQIDLDDLESITGYRLTPKRAKALGIDMHGIDYFLAYTNSDCVWQAQITASELQALINDNSEI